MYTFILLEENHSSFGFEPTTDLCNAKTDVLPLLTMLSLFSLGFLNIYQLHTARVADVKKPVFYSQSVSLSAHVKTAISEMVEIKGCWIILALSNTVIVTIPELWK